MFFLLDPADLTLDPGYVTMQKDQGQALLQQQQQYYAPGPGPGYVAAPGTQPLQQVFAPQGFLPPYDIEQNMHAQSMTNAGQTASEHALGSTPSLGIVGQSLGNLGANYGERLGPVSNQGDVPVSDSRNLGNLDVNIGQNAIGQMQNVDPTQSANNLGSEEGGGFNLGQNEIGRPQTSGAQDGNVAGLEGSNVAQYQNNQARSTVGCESTGRSRLC